VPTQFPSASSVVTAAPDVVGQEMDITSTPSASSVVTAEPDIVGQEMDNASMPAQGPSASSVTSAPAVIGEEMDELFGKMIDSQSGSEDNCHSQLTEAKRQLKSLHILVVDLARQVNSTADQIMMFDRSLQEKLREMADVSQWSDVESKKCKVQTEKAREMFVKLKSELSQMNSIASPGVSLNIGSGKLQFENAEDSTQAQLSLAQTGQGIKQHEQHQSMAVDFSGDDHSEIGHDVTQLGHHIASQHTRSRFRSDARVASMQQSSHSLDKLSGLLRAARQASEKFQSCMESVRSAHISVAMLSEGAPTKPSNECDDLKVSLQETYVKAYIELSRMEVQYEEQANSTACADSVKEQYKNQRTPLQEAADKISGEINDKTEEMQSLRPRLQSTQASEVKLREQVSELTDQCAELSPTISALDAVRDAIAACAKCAGLNGSMTVKFSLPKWTGKWATFHQDSAAQTDTEQDRLMNLECSSNTEGSRAAEVGEIQGQTVQGIPKINTAPTPLLGACPACEGDHDETFQSGHSRICWDPGVPLSLENRRNDCGAGKKAILCVIDSSAKIDTAGLAGETEEAGLMQSSEQHDFQT
jgi:uncharacterized coiled-coil DUF342 family protein